MHTHVSKVKMTAKHVTRERDEKLQAMAEETEKVTRA